MTREDWLQLLGQAALWALLVGMASYLIIDGDLPVRFALDR